VIDYILELIYRETGGDREIAYIEWDYIEGDAYIVRDERKIEKEARG